MEEGGIRSRFWNMRELQHWDLQHFRNQEHPVLSRFSCRSSNLHNAISFLVVPIAWCCLVHYKLLEACFFNSVRMAFHSQKLSDLFLTCLSPCHWEIFAMSRRCFRVEQNSEESCACERPLLVKGRILVPLSWCPAWASRSASRKGGKAAARGCTCRGVISRVVKLPWAQSRQACGWCDGGSAGTLLGKLLRDLIGRRLVGKAPFSLHQMAKQLCPIVSERALLTAAKWMKDCR